MKSTLRVLLGATVASCFALPAFALTVTDKVKINEVSYDPGETPEDPFEFIELYNAGTTTAFLDGAAISDEGNVGTAEATFVFPGVVGGTTIPLAAGAYMVIVGDATGTTLPADYELFGGGTDSDAPAVPNLTKSAGTGIDLLLGNSGDGITLSTGTTNGSVIPCTEVVDGVSWEGNTTDVTAMSSTVCADPASSPGYANTTTPLTILSMQRCPNGVDTDNSTVDFSMLNRTPKAANACNNIPPTIASLRYTPCFVTANQTVQLLCDVSDENSDLTSVKAFYKLDSSALFDSIPMTAGVAPAYSATLPGRPDQSHVQYYVEAKDALGNRVKSPSTAPAFLRSYRVGLQTIASLQGTALPDSCSNSTELGKAVNVVGVVTNRAYEYSPNFFYIQQGITPSSGIKVFTQVDSTFVPNLGDSVRVSGFIDEFRCQTEVTLFSTCGTVLGTNRRVRARQLSSVSDINNEINESMLVNIQGPITVLTAFDGTNLGDEFKVGQGIAFGYVGDDTFFPDGVGYTVIPAPGMLLDALTGIVAYRQTNTTTPGPRENPSIILRLEPRRDNDVDRDYTDVGDGDRTDVVKAFRLSQNNPNPFNPVTTIEFSIARAGEVALRIYDSKGQLVRTVLEAAFTGPTTQRVIWDGRDDRGHSVGSGLYFYKLEAEDGVATRKMLLLK